MPYEWWSINGGVKLSFVVKPCFPLVLAIGIPATGGYSIIIPCSPLQYIKRLIVKLSMHYCFCPRPMPSYSIPLNAASDARLLCMPLKIVLSP
jgi:hypothetical protein